MIINGRRIESGQPAYIIAEMSANHAGSLERGKEIIHAAKEAGADCVKIQTYTADTITMNCANEYFQIKTGTWEKENLYHLYEKAYTPWEWQPELYAEAKKVGIDFFSTPFDRMAVDFLEEMEMEFYKIASFELVDIPLIQYVASKGKPIIMSTGMATLAEIEEAVRAIRDTGNEDFALLRCASAYPAIADEMNLSTMMDMQQRFRVPVGLSDHSMGALAAVTAVAMGGSIIEKHFCISRDIANPDASFSMEPDEFAKMVTEIRMAEKAKGVVKYGPTKQEQSNLGFRKSIFVTRDINAGEHFTEQNIRVIRPANGLHPREYANVLDKEAKVNIQAGMPLKAEDIKEYIQVVLARSSDSKLLFDWANEKEVRRNSFSNKSITWEEHQTWFQQVMQNENCHLFIGMHEQEQIGMLRFDVENESARISYSIALEYRGRGYAAWMIDAGMQQMKIDGITVSEYCAAVKCDNIPSQKVFERLGYVRRQEEGKDYVLYSYRCK